MHTLIPDGSHQYMNAWTCSFLQSLKPSNLRRCDVSYFWVIFPNPFPLTPSRYRLSIRLERELEESGAAEDGEVEVDVLKGGPDKTAGGILVSMAKAGAFRLQ